MRTKRLTRSNVVQTSVYTFMQKEKLLRLYRDSLVELSKIDEEDFINPIFDVIVDLEKEIDKRYNNNRITFNDLYIIDQESKSKAVKKKSKRMQIYVDESDIIA